MLFVDSHVVAAYKTFKRAAGAASDPPSDPPGGRLTSGAPAAPTQSNTPLRGDTLKALCRMSDTASNPSQAERVCRTCRARKRKCDKSVPRCSSCIK